MDVLCIGHAAGDISVFVDGFPAENSKCEIRTMLEAGGGPAANAAYLASAQTASQMLTARDNAPATRQLRVHPGSLCMGWGQAGPGTRSRQSDGGPPILQACCYGIATVLLPWASRCPWE